MVEGDADSGGDGGDCLDGTFLGETAKKFPSSVEAMLRGRNDTRSALLQTATTT
mgnify:CR=1 FL=1